MNELKNDRQLFDWSRVPLNGYLQKYLSETLFSPVQEFVSRPRKSIRSALVQVGYQWAGVTPDDKSLKLAELLEGVHSGSLIVDDIQDGSVIRRDGPTFHIKHGVPKALNAGNWLYFWSLKKIKDITEDVYIQTRLTQVFHDTLFEGHIGQALDLGRPVTEVPKEEISNLCYSTMALKTGSLVALGIVSGAILGDVDDIEATELSQIGNELGMILQIYDDLKNFKLGEIEEVDFSVDKSLEDLKNLRPGFVWAFASENGEEESFQNLVDAVGELPKVGKLKAWIKDSNIHELAVTQLNERISRFQIHVKNTAVKYGRSESHWTLIEGLIKKLEEAYERS